MATVVKGENFVSDPSVTGQRLNDTVDNATVSNIAQADIAANSGLIVRSASAPSDTDAGWWDTGNNVLRVHDGTSWTPVATGALLTNKSGGAIVASDVVIADSSNDNAFTTTTTEGDTTVIGVAAESIANDATGVVLYGGVQDVLITGTVNRSEFLKTSTTAKKATSSVAKASGSFAVALETGTNTTIKALITSPNAGLDGTGTETISGNWTFSGTLNASSATFTPPNGYIRQVVRSQDQTPRTITVTTGIPNDDTVPPNTEGGNYSQLDTAITAASASNSLLIHVQCFASVVDGNSQTLKVILYKDSGATQATMLNGVNTSGFGAVGFPVDLWFHESPADTSAHTYKVNLAIATGTSNPIVNEHVTADFGDTLVSSMTIYEIVGGF